MSRHYCLNYKGLDDISPLGACRMFPFEDGPMCRACGCHVCGGIILADTEEWPHPLCAACFEDFGYRFEDNKKWAQP